MKKLFLSIFALSLSLTAFANDNNTDSDFMSEEKLEEGFVTSYINRSIENAMQAQTAKAEELKYGRAVTGFVSAPKFGGYVIGRYQYSD